MPGTAWREPCPATLTATEDKIPSPGGTESAVPPSDTYQPGSRLRQASPIRPFMYPHKLTQSEARAVVRRHAHDLRNMLCSMDLGIACLLEEPESARSDARQKLMHQLALTGEIVCSLAIRFQKPSRSTAAAADIFENWRQQRHKLRQGVPVHWEESSCQSAITVDANAIVTVLCEICRRAKSPAGLVAEFAEKDHSICFSIREPASLKAHRDNPPQAQQWKEWQRLVKLSGGKIETVVRLRRRPDRHRAALCRPRQSNHTNPARPGVANFAFVKFPWS
jgi:hypothetical protein